MHGGVGTAAQRERGGGTVGVLVAINAVGAVRDPSTGSWVAGARGPKGTVVPPERLDHVRGRTTGTTLALVVTDLTVDRPTLARVASIVHAGLSAAIRPFHSSTDGDVLFAAATGASGSRRPESRPGELADRLGMRASALAVAAVLGAVRAANASE